MIADKVDVVIIGGGHAGCEAGLAAARLGLKTILFTLSVDNIAFMPCNPHIGGSSKGHLVREIDALGGEMGKNIDKTYLQSKMLNKSKGPAIHSLRAQADKMEYSKSMKMILQNQENLIIKQTEISEIIYEELDEKNDPELLHSGYERRVKAVKTVTGLIYETKAIVLCTGTYLKSRCLCGESIQYTGPNGLQPSNLLSESLIKGGIELRRFKTGTPARMDGNSIDYSKMEIQTGDTPVVPFSFDTDPDSIQKDQYNCYLTYTNEKTHEIIRNNIDRSPIYAGIIEGIGPRYCPSIEDKVVKFPDKIRHQVFVEPEGTHTNEMYIDGMSSSMPEDVQLQMYRSVPGLENCIIVKNAYAIEYDCLCSGQLHPTLEIKKVRGLFSAGQFNGSSGYEEAAAQGLYAGINACMQILNKPYLTIDRSEGYIGVLVDDLVTKDNLEPYRMMTSRAEYRLLLRQDNADIRLRKKGYEVGLISEEKYEHLITKEKQIEEETERIKNIKVGAAANVQDFMDRHNSPRLKTAVSLAELICRPELDYDTISELDPNRPELSKEVIEQVEINIKYEGYIDRQQRQVDKFRKMEKKLIPDDINYDDVLSLRLEARANLKKFMPKNVGQASRISGVNPADISVLLVYLENYNRQHD